MSEKWDIKLTLEEFNHLADSNGKCDCELCKRFKERVKDYLAYVENVKRNNEKVI